MDKATFNLSIRELGLSPKTAANVLSVDPRTVDRWLKGDVAVPGPVAQAVEAWKRLQRARIPWRPEGMPLAVMDQEEVEEQIRLLREHCIDLAEVLDEVAERGGPAAPWDVDLKAREAKLAGQIHVHFHALPNGGFATSSYYREDQEPDLRRDMPLIHDAIACIARAIGRVGPKWADDA